MKRVKLLLSFVSLCFAFSVLCFCVYAATQVNYQLGGNISYEVTGAYVEVRTKVYTSPTHLDEYQVIDAAQDAVNLEFGASIPGLNYLKESPKYSSLNRSVPSSYDIGSLYFSTDNSNPVYAYIFVINVKNLSQEINVWAKITSASTIANTNIYYNYLQADILQTQTNADNKNIVIAVALDDETENVPQSNSNNFNYTLTIKSGYAGDDATNLSKLNFTYENSGYTVSAKNTSIAGDIIIPGYYTDPNTGVTAKVKKVGSFANCTAITSVYIPTQVEEITQYCFDACSSIENLWLPFCGHTRENPDWSGQVSIGGLFSPSGEGMEELDPPNGFSSLLCFNGGFLPKTLNTVELLEGCTIIPNMFFSTTCEEGPRWYNFEFDGDRWIATLSPRDIDFYPLKKIIMPNSVTILGSENIELDGRPYYDGAGFFTFAASYGIEYIRLSPNINCNQLAETFWGNQLKRVKIPDGVLYITGGTFANDAPLEELYIPNTAQFYVNPPESFACTYNIRKVTYTTVSANYSYVNGTLNVLSGSVSNGIFTNPIQTCLGRIVLHVDFSQAGTITSLDSSAFSNYYNLQEITLPNTLETIGASAFDKCVNLQSITIPASVTTIGANALKTGSSGNGCRLRSIVNNATLTSAYTLPTYTGYVWKVNGQTVTTMQNPGVYTLVQNS